MKKQFLLAAVLSFAFALTGCGGGDDEGDVIQAVSDTTVAMDPNTGDSVSAAVRGTPFVFPAGVPALGTSGATTVTFTAASGSASQLSTNSGNNGFVVTSGGQTATGTLTFGSSTSGSCIFSVQNSNFPTGSRLAIGSVITVSPCSLFINSAGLPADSQARARIIRLILGATNSANATAQVAVNVNGTLFVNGIPVANISVQAVTGLTGS